MGASLLLILLLINDVCASSIDTPDPSVLSNLPSTNIPYTSTSPIQVVREDLLKQFSHDMSNINSLPLSKLTTPCHLISKDSSNTRAWDLDYWDIHCQSSLRRYTRHICSWPSSTSLKSILPTVILVLSWSVIVVLATRYSPLMNDMVLKLSLPSGIIGTFISPIALLLSIRANRALNRLMEVRSAWGIMGKSIRSLTGVIATYGVFAIQPSEEDVKEQDVALISISLLAARYLAIFGWCMKAAFRHDEDDSNIIRSVLPKSEADWLLTSPSKRPIAIISRVRGLIQQLSSLGRYNIPPMIHLTLEQRLYDLESTFGICNRILMSPIPPTYTRHTSRVLCLFLFLLPINFAGSKTSPLALLLSVITITYCLVGIDEIGLEIEHPFPLLPMQNMAETFQKNVEKQLLLLSSAPC